MKSDIQDGLASALLLVAKKNGIDTRHLDKGIEITRSKDLAYGDFTSNIAVVYAETFGLVPCKLADLLVVSVPLMDDVVGLEVASSGVINIRLTQESVTAVLKDVVEKSDTFGVYNPPHAQKILLSLRGIGVLDALSIGMVRHVAHVASLANLLVQNGHQVDVEVLVDDTEQSVDVLLLSVYWRYAQLCGQEIDFVEKLVNNKHVSRIAKQLKAEHGDSLSIVFNDWLPAYSECVKNDDWIEQTLAVLKVAISDYDTFAEFVSQDFFTGLKQDLAVFSDGVRLSLRSAVSSDGVVNSMLDELRAAELLSEKDGCIWLQADIFADKKKRLLQCDGEDSALTTDMAYYFDRYARDYHFMIDVFGIEKRDDINVLKTSLAALKLNEKKVHFCAVQPVRFSKDNRKLPYTLSLHDLCRKTDVNALKFFTNMRKSAHHLEINLSLAESKSEENPFYQVQYAYERCCALLKKAEVFESGFDVHSALSSRHLLLRKEEKSLLRELSRYCDVVETAGDLLSPQMIVTYLQELAEVWHPFCDAEDEILNDDESLRNARLLLVYCVRQVLRNALSIIGICVQEQM